MAAQASSQALEGVANAQYELKAPGGGVRVAASRLLKDYGSAMIGTHSKKQAETRLKELAALTGYVSIRVNEARRRTCSSMGRPSARPVAALIRVAAGPHKVDVSKAGFTPVTKTPNVTANGK